MQLVQAKGEVTRADVVELLHVTPSQAYRILQKLKNAGQLSLDGKGAGAKYHTTKLQKRTRAFSVLCFRTFSRTIPDIICQKKDCS